MNRLKNIAIALLSVTAWGCGDDFLDISPVSSLGELEVVQTMDDLENALNGAYTYLKYWRGDQPYVGDLLAEDFMCTQNASGHLGYAYEYNNTKNSCPTGVWNRTYTGSFHINSILEKADHIKEKNSRYNEIISELKFIRAILHFEGVRAYGPLPGNLGKGGIQADALGVMICDKVPENIRQTFYRDKVSDVYRFIITDMEQNVDALSKNKKNGYLNYYGGKAFMARVYLYHEDWGKALTCAKEVIEKGPYQLYERKDYVNVWKNEFTSESILEIKSSETDNSSWNSIGYYADTAGYAAVAATKDFEAVMAQDPSDIRFSLLTYSHNKGYYAPMGKYPGRDGNTKICNPKVIRLSEMYLIAAECAMRLNDPTAGKYLSDLREKRSLQNPRKYDSGITIEDVLYERRVELFCEGQRCWDLWRNQKTVVRWENIEEKEAKGHWDRIGVIPYNDYRTIWPLAISQVDLWEGEDQIKQQNPGY